MFSNQADNFGITNYDANDRIVNVLGHVDGGVTGSANGKGYTKIIAPVRRIRT